MTERQNGSPDQKIGRFDADIRWIKDKLSEIDQKIDNTHTTHSGNYSSLDERIRALEKFRSRLLGGCAVLGAVVSVALATMRIVTQTPIF